MADPMPYRPGIDDAGDAPLGADNALPADPADPAAADPVANTAAWRRAVLALLTEIRDALAGEAP